MQRSSYFSIVLLLASLLWQCGDKDDSLFFFWPASANDGYQDNFVPIDTIEEDSQGVPEFEFQTSREIGVDIRVRDQNGVLPDAVVLVLAGDEKLFQATTDQNGQMINAFNLVEIYEVITLKILAGEHTITQLIPTAGLLGIKRTIEIQAAVRNDYESDLDGDGIPDVEDSFPEDPDRAAVIYAPSTRFLVVAFEDLYPRPGDADFNDYVVLIKDAQEDLNARGEIVAIRATYEHIGAGAGYKNKLMLNIPGQTEGTVQQTILESDGTIKGSREIRSSDLKAIDIFNGLHSKQTLYGAWNSTPGEAIKRGMQARLAIQFNQPITRAQIGSAPYDLYLSVLKQGNEEVVQIHLPGRSYDNNGSDRYIDSNGFPWALQIPQMWNWPLSGRNIHDAYLNFELWYSNNRAGEAVALDWYKQPSKGYTFQFFNLAGTGLEAFLGAGHLEMQVLLLLSIVAIIALVIIRWYRGRNDDRANNRTSLL